MRFYELRWAFVPKTVVHLRLTGAHLRGPLYNGKR
jgi:hypothetical protein